MYQLADLQNIIINHELVTIRHYQTEDFLQLEKIFETEFFEWFFTNYATCQEFVTEKLAACSKGELVFLVMVDNITKKIIGTSSLSEISYRHKRLEMGSSWLARKYQGTYYNALNKYLLIDYLLNKLQFLRIQWKTDALNKKSQVAMGKLGFIYEGTLRRHAITTSGRVRDSQVFAVTDLDWPEVSQIIIKRLIDKKYSGQALDLPYKPIE